MCVASPRGCLLAFAMLAAGCGRRTEESQVPQGGEKACGHGYAAKERDFEPVRARRGSCDVTIESLLEANVYMGYVESPSFWDGYKRLDAESRKMWDEESHGECYLSCRYVVLLNGKRYKHEHTSWQSPCDTLMEPAMCSDPFEARCTTEDIFSATRECTDIHAGEYYGDWFEPIDELGPPKAKPTKRP